MFSSTATSREPGTCKDHLIFLHDPHAVIEGTIIAGLAIGAKLASSTCAASTAISSRSWRKP
jgi:NADH:ubiquinone oxidoreductase subunit F (NADH-binding)